MKINAFPSFFCLPVKRTREPADTVAPVITMVSATNNQVFAMGRTVVVGGRTSNTTKVEELHLELTNKITGPFIMHEHFPPGSPGHTLARTFTLSPSAPYK